jgi:hypothetical protein
MPRVIVTTDPVRLPDNVSVLLDERIHAVHVSSDHAAAQLVERIAWAISDAEDAELAATEVAAARERPVIAPRRGSVAAAGSRRRHERLARGVPVPTAG